MSYKEALRRISALLVAHLFVSLVIVALLVPLIGVLIAVTLSFSDQPALTDHDIAHFLLTLPGTIGALMVGTLTIVAVVFDIAFMTAIFRSGQRSVSKSMQAGTGIMIAAFPRLVGYATELLLRVVAVSAPFLIAAAIPAALLLRDFDINYYLAIRPPAFMGAVAFAATCLFLLGLVLLERISAWAIAMHYVVFDAEQPRPAFRLSRQKMNGHRLRLTRKVVAWMLIRFAGAALLVSVTGMLLAEVPRFFGGQLPLFFLVMTVLLGLWALANAGMSALANGALADILNEEFDRSLEARPAKVPVDPDPKGKRIYVAPIVITAVSLVSLVFGGFAFNTLQGVEEVDVIAHRGASAVRPENTLAAVVKAIEDGANWVEVDVQETADGQVIVAHDSDFMKAAGNPLKIWDATMADIAKIDIGSWFDPTYASERAPTLREVLAVVQDTSSKLIIELKYYGHDMDLENRVVSVVEDAGMAARIATMSLKYPAVQKMQKLRPDWRAGVLAATSVGNLSGLQGDFLAISVGGVSRHILAQAAYVGKDVYVWTVNDPALMSRMITLGVDGLITDVPAEARAMIEYHKSLSTVERFMLRLGDIIGYAFDLTPENEDDA